MSTYNHTRGDGPYDPCDICLVEMSWSDLLEYVRDLRECRKLFKEKDDLNG